MSTQHQQSIHVAVGVIKTDDKHVLISKRHAHLHQGGLWEFPGGKIDAGETVQQALARESHEELGITVSQTQPLIQIPYDYGDKHVLLDVHVVTAYSGEPHSKEDQEIRIVPIAALRQFDFPAANRGIVSAVRLPQRYMITREYASVTELLDSVEQAIANGVTLIQYRDHSLDGRDYRQRLKQIRQCCVDNDVLLIANTSLENFQQHDVDGLHLTSRRLLDCQQRPVNESMWLGASVHNLSQLQHALSINVDYVLLSPVKYTASHPDALPIGWSGFQSMALQSSVPVYALGGMTDDDLSTAIACGGRGIAGISLFS